MDSSLNYSWSEGFSMPILCFDDMVYIETLKGSKRYRDCLALIEGREPTKTLETIPQDDEDGGKEGTGNQESGEEEKGGD